MGNYQKQHSSSISCCVGQVSVLHYKQENMFFTMSVSKEIKTTYFLCGADSGICLIQGYVNISYL